jgi:hypothetical protein
MDEGLSFCLKANVNEAQETQLTTVNKSYLKEILIMNAITEIIEFSKKAQGRKEMIKHLEGERLYRNEAIKAKRFDCMGKYFDGIVSCEIPACPLSPYNPYGRKGENQGEEVVEGAGGSLDACQRFILIRSVLIETFLNGGNWELIAEYAEVESGKKSDRPELKKALEHCKRTKSTLVIAKLDRLSRSVAFLSNLMESGVEFVAVDMLFANKLTLHIMASMAEHER